MSVLLEELRILCADLRSDKVSNRNKATERLDSILSNSKSDMIAAFSSRNESRDISWDDLFISAIDATLKHSAKIDTTHDTKACQTMRNKNYIFNSIVTKIIDFNLEGGNFLSKSTIFSAFIDCFSNRSAIKHFGIMLLNLLDRGLYKSLSYVRDIKVNEYSRILSYLFETNVFNDELLRFSILRTISKTIELAASYVQLSCDLADYFPEISAFAQKANDDRRKSDVISLFYLLVSQLAVDFRHTICSELQDVLPVMCDFYHYHMKIETKETLFNAIFLSLITIYPQIHNGDSFNFHINFKDSWNKTLRKIKTITDIEIKERKLSRHRTNLQTYDKCVASFIKMSSLVAYIIYWHMEDNSNNTTEIEEPQRKISKPTDKIEIILALIKPQSDESSMNELWFAILTDMICNYDAIINISNFLPVLQMLIQILNATTAAINTFQNIRYCLTAMLYYEKQFLTQRVMTLDICKKSWSTIVDFLLSEYLSANEVIADKQILFQVFIAYGKLTSTQCCALLNTIVSNPILKRTECFETIRQVFMSADDCDVDKTSQIIQQIITWSYEVNEKINVKNIILNIEPIDPEIIADTCAIAVVNFLEKHHFTSKLLTKSNTYKSSNNHQMILYKYNRKYVFLEEHGNSMCHVPKLESHKKNGLFQSNYELLMRVLNYETSNETSFKYILLDLTSLHKIISLMKYLIKYNVFDEENINHCPLMKRIGFFLSHLEFQFKNNHPRDCDRSDLYEIMQRLESVFGVFNSNKILLDYLEKQPLDELIEFLGATLKFGATHQLSSEFDDWQNIIDISLKILAILCTSTTHCSDALAQLLRHKLNIKTDINIFLTIVEIFCSHKNVNAAVVNWIVERLKIVFKLYHTNIEIVDRIIKLFPSIFEYVQQFEDPLQDMLIALTSLLKIAYKRSYSVQLTTNLIESIRFIVRRCNCIFGQDSFTSICLSIAKFLTFTSLQIQYAAINTIIALMDFNWLNITAATTTEIHYDFCQQLFAQIDYKSLPASTIDLKQNSISVTIQLFGGLFAFSCYFQEIALQELAYFCALRKLTKEDVQIFNEIASYYKCSISDITKPYLRNVIHAWMGKKYPILKFPYFLCSVSKDEFIRDNLSDISLCVLLYSKADDLKRLESYATKDELIELALPIAHSFILVHQAECTETKSDIFKNHMKTLRENLITIGFDVKRFDNLSCMDYKTVCCCIDLFKDEEQFLKLFGFRLFKQQSKWFNLNYTSLKRCLNIYIRGIVEEIQDEAFFEDMITKEPINLVRVLDTLKEHSYAPIFPMEKLKHFYTYCITMELVLNGIPNMDKISTVTQNCAKYFVRDCIFFILHYAYNAEEYQARKMSLEFLSHILKKPIIASGFCSETINSYLGDILKNLCKIVEKNDEESDIAQLGIDIITSVVESRVELCEEIGFFTELPATIIFNDIRQKYKHKSGSDQYKGDIHSALNMFVQKRENDIEELKIMNKYISKHKSAIQQDGDILYALIGRLIDIVRNSKNIDLKLEATKCMGQIGPLKIDGVSYYFQSDVTLYENETISLNALEYFIHSLLIALEKLLLNFKLSIQRPLCDVAQQCINAGQGKKFIANFPYFSVFSLNHQSPSYMDTFPSIAKINWLSILKSTEALDYENWICTFVSQLFKCCDWKAFQELASHDSQFAQTALQPFVKLLMSHKQVFLDDLIIMLQHFLSEFTKFRNDSATSKKTIYMEKRIISEMLNICECIRIHNDWDLPVNLLYAAEASNYCQAYFMSIMYLELCALNSAAEGKPNSELITSESFQESAIKAYRSIDCCDAITGFLDPLQSRIEFLHLDNNWSDIMLEASSDAIMSNTLYTSVLKRNGMLSLANLNRTNENIDYEVCWRLYQWDTAVDGHSKIDTLNDMEQEYEKHHFNSLKCLSYREENNTIAAIGKARHCILSILNEISIECLQSVYKYLTWLHLLQQVDDFCQIQFTTTSLANEILNKWELEVDLQYGSFEFKETIISHQIALFNTAGIRANRKIKEFYKDNPIESCLLKCIKECKNAGELNLAKRNIALLKSMEISNEQNRVSVLLEDAEICFRTGQFEITKAILQHILKNKNFAFCLQRVHAYRMQGEYFLESSMETFETVLRNFFNASLNLIEQFSKSKEQILQKYPGLFDLETFDDFAKSNRKSAYEAIAKYADKEYNQLNIYVNSEEYQMKCTIIQHNREAADSIGKQNKNRDKNLGAIVMKKFANLDEKEVQSIEKKRTENLCIAIENYIKFCEVDSSIFSPMIYRIIALWFANKQNVTLHEKIMENILRVPSYKFICALNQITARLNSKNEPFVAALKDILIRCTQDHPHHALYQLYSLVFAHNDDTTLEKTNNRVAIAKEIIAKSVTKTNGKCIKQLEHMIPALIEFANVEMSGAKNTHSIPLSDNLKKIKNLDAIHCPTVDLSISLNKEYSVTSIVKWDSKADLVGGINAPKKLNCLCSDGKTRPQLLKGKDDLRQDAVMQQIFSMINDLLANNPEAVQRKLTLRTYKVVPLSMRSGILEWCLNTIPLGTYLGNDGKGGAHKKYRPNDYISTKCRQLSMQHLKSDIDKRHQVYLHICENIKPVLHYFLFEKFLVPGVWFERRLAYMNSVATTSIVGYILGLGDRHTQNILIDEKTAEVIHIDFGIAFEQGKVMPTPETVPFRLTRDMVSPMGICETNGIFRKSCEATARILRANQTVITTILEVLLYDPLYIWNVVPQLHESNDENGQEQQNLTAQRALLIVQNKLEGKQAGSCGARSVEVQVQRLINDARSSRNLCMLYPGWDPYL